MKKKRNAAFKNLQPLPIVPRKVMIATPSYDGKAQIEYFMSVHAAVQIAASQNIQIFPVFVAYDSLVQRARNDLVAIAIETQCDDIVFIDSDVEFNPHWVLSLLNRKEHVVGGTVRKKTDEAEIYAIKMDTLEKQPNGLIPVPCLATAFLKISGTALRDLWNASPEYRNENKICRMVCNVEINANGDLISEDIALCEKLAALGYQSYLDPTMTCNHIGTKKFVGNIDEYIDRIKTSAAA